jgi:hypothetical protein
VTGTTAHGRGAAMSLRALCEGIELADPDFAAFARACGKEW